MWVYGRFMGRTGVEERHDDTLPLAETPRQVIASLGGRYVVERELGRGGMGVVLLARDEKLGRNVALKVLSRSASAEQLQRFEQEARAAGALNHPNVIAVYDAGLASGQPYIVSELLEGGTLRERLGGRPLGVRQAIDYAVQLARGLAAAHEHDIVHRDLKPENLFITNEGRLKILDFGIAKLPRPETDSRTLTGEVMGTVGYMSPEQVRGEPADARSDIFSFGAIFYEMLAGKPAFERPNAIDSSYAVAHEDPTELPEQVAAEIDRVVRRCLAKKPAQRYQTAHALALDVQALAGSTDSRRVPRLGVPQQRAVFAALLAAAAGLAVGAFGWAWLHPHPVPTFEQLTFARGRILDARFVPGGSSAVYAGLWDGTGQDVYTATAGSLESRPLGLGSANLLAVSRAGELLIQLRPRFTQNGDVGTLARVSLQGGSPRELADDVLAADWAADGERFAVVRLQGGQSHLQFPAGHDITVRSYFIDSLRIAPDGRHIAIGDIGDRVEILDANGALRATRASQMQRMAWLSDDELVVAELDKGGTTLRGLSVSGEVRPVASLPGKARLQDLSQGRALVLMEQTRMQIAAALDGTNEEKEVPSFDESYFADVTSDGSTVLFADLYGKGSFVRRMDGAAATRLTSWKAFCFSPDARKVVALTDEGGLAEVPVGPGNPVRLPADGLEIEDVRYFPDGEHLLVEGRQPGHGLRLFVRDRMGTSARPISPEGTEHWRAISPDGKLVAGVDSALQTRLYPVDGGAPRAVPLRPGFVPAGFSADGRFLTAFAVGEVPARRMRVDLAKGTVASLPPILRQNGVGVRAVYKMLLTSDGRSSVYGFRRTQSNLLIVSGLR